MFFMEPYYYIHGTHDLGSIGKADSHGCVRLPNATAVDLAEELMAHGAAPMSMAAVEGTLDHPHETREVYLSHPIPLTIR